MVLSMIQRDGLTPSAFVWGAGTGFSALRGGRSGRPERKWTGATWITSCGRKICLSWIGIRCVEVPHKGANPPGTMGPKPRLWRRTLCEKN